MKKNMMVLLVLGLWMCIYVPLQAAEGNWKGPWGKDAQLVKKKVIEEPKTKCGLIESLAVSAIWFHKKVISPADGPRSHFRPNSSQYAIDAIERYGFWHGFLLGCDRLMRENPEPWIYRTLLVENHWVTKWDPVK